MRQVVRVALVTLTEKFEAFADYFYADVKSLVSIGDGFLADPAPRIPAGLLFMVAGRPATPVEIMSSWRAVKDHATQETAMVRAWEAGGKKDKRPQSPLDGGGHYQFVPGNIVRATKESIAQVFASMQASNETYLRRYFPDYDNMCADAQLGLHLMSWAYGAAFSPKWPHLTAAIRNGQWEEAANQAKPSDKEMAAQNDSFHRRVAAIQTCFRNAGLTKDPETLSYPQELAAN